MAVAIEWGDIFTDTFGNFFGFLPNLLAALAIFVGGWLIAKFLYRIIARVLSRIGIDKLVDRSGLGAPLEKAGYPDSGVFLAKILYIMIMLVVVKLAVDALKLTAIQDLFDQLIAWIPKLFVAILIMFLVGALANFVKEFVGGLLQAQSWGNLATNAIVGLIWFIGGMAALDQINIASDIVGTLFSTVMSALAGILVIMFGVGGIWMARDHFWPAVRSSMVEASKDTTA